MFSRFRVASIRVVRKFKSIMSKLDILNYLDKDHSLIGTNFVTKSPPETNNHFLKVLPKTIPPWTVYLISLSLCSESSSHTHTLPSIEKV
jgi:hypothetical protein